MDKFVSESPCKMPQMNVKVVNKHNEYIKEYSTPAGFQLERYLAEQNPEHNFIISFPPGKFEVKVYDSDNHFIETHCGVYAEQK